MKAAIKRNTGGYSLLIKGVPGAGKTIFSLTLLKEVCENWITNGIEKAGGIYLSTRINPQILYEDFPYLRDYIEPENILDATKSRFPNPSDVSNLFKYRNWSSFIGTVYEKVENFDKSIVVVDSWDAVCQQLKETQREELEKEIIEFCRMSNILLVLVSEYVRQKELDYLVDSITSLFRRFEGHKTVRELKIEKLRGVKIINSTYTFNLDGGMFNYYEPRKEFQECKSINNRLSIGIKELDEMMHGGILQGDQTLVVGSSGTGKTTLAGQFILAEIMAGGKALYISLEEPREKIKALLERLGCPKNRVEEDIKIQSVNILDLDIDRLIEETESNSIGRGRVVVDSISCIVDAVRKKQSYGFLLWLTRLLKNQGTSSLLIADTPELFGIKTITTGKVPVSQLIDNIILLRYVEISSSLRKALSILKMRNSSFDNFIREYMIQEKGLSIIAKTFDYQGLMSGIPTPVAKRLLGLKDEEDLSINAWQNIESEY